jgi:hypothetical protein
MCDQLRASRTLVPAVTLTRATRHQNRDPGIIAFFVDNAFVADPQNKRISLVGSFSV